MKKLLICILVCTLAACLCGCTALEEVYLAGLSPEAQGSAHSEESTVPAESSDPADPVPTPAVSAAAEQYTNETFGFTVTLPAGWIRATDEDIEEMYGQAQGFLEENASSAPRILMVCTQYRISNYNPAITIESAGFQPIDIETQKALLESVYTELYAQRSVKSVEVTATPSCVINGTDYLLFSIAADFGTYTIVENQYYIALGDSWVVFCLAYFTNAQKEIMDNFMQSIVYTASI